jgi:ADP-ribose pyrophosphatase
LRPDASRRAFTGRLISVDVERWGEHEREIVVHGPAVAIVAVDVDGCVTLVRQQREAVRKRLLELPAGSIAEGEDPLAAARRELAEETGLRGAAWRELASFLTTPGFCDELMHLFVVEGARAGESAPEPDEEIELVRVPLSALPDVLSELEDAKTIAGLLLYLRTRGQ